MLATSYTLSATTSQPFPVTVERVRDELKAEGFGVLSEIDVQATLRAKLGVEEEPYLILGALQPNGVAHQALSAEPELGTLLSLQRRRLPTNVTVKRTSPRLTPSGCSRSLATTGSPPVAAEVRRQARPRRRTGQQSPLAVVPKDVVHPGLLGGWGCRSHQLQGGHRMKLAR